MSLLVEKTVHMRLTTSSGGWRSFHTDGTSIYLVRVESSHETTGYRGRAPRALLKVTCPPIVSLSDVVEARPVSNRFGKMAFDGARGI
jgi:hypothetical protein